MPIKDTGIVNIHGKDYKTVAKRVDEFRSEHKSELSIITSLVDRDEKTVVMKAEIIDKEGRTIATGYAEENRANGQINKTSALENCETSAIGRALANFGLGGGEYASADELTNKLSQQAAPAPKKSGLNFDEINKHLQTLSTRKEVDEYAKEVAKMCANPTEQQRYKVRTLFTNRREEIVNESRTV